MIPRTFLHVTPRGSLANLRQQVPREPAAAYGSTFALKTVTHSRVLGQQPSKLVFLLRNLTVTVAVWESTLETVARYFVGY
jgi:hypothetical protein